ncbi:hypothetical protein M011DRAFT_266971 [Sporormia fimetaria CBS 119925]|uniref:Uncharacterized protein n=1 Tax=Sporormia fimetaria CBS 119925 TaxID=1340428 RepID=A0A6A6UY69_9PLEO|nr:hypothetical protein M011DRAFT_266971 [Sporormia fimetaria CBS 119925]
MLMHRENKGRGIGGALGTERHSPVGIVDRAGGLVASCVLAAGGGHLQLRAGGCGAGGIACVRRAVYIGAVDGRCGSDGHRVGGVGGVKADEGVLQRADSRMGASSAGEAHVGVERCAARGATRGPAMGRTGRSLCAGVGHRVLV